MYNSPALSRSPEQNPTSPSHYPSRESYHARNAQAAQPFAQARGHPPSPSSSVPLTINNVSSMARDRPVSTFYDPISENRERKSNWQAPIYENQPLSLVGYCRSAILQFRTFGDSITKRLTIAANSACYVKCSSPPRTSLFRQRPAIAINNLSFTTVADPSCASRSSPAR